MSRIYDTDRFKNTISRAFSKLRDETTNAAILENIQLAEQQILQDVEENTQVIIVDNLTKQRFMYSLAGYCILRDERKEWYLYKAINDVITHPEVDALLRKQWGTEYTNNIYRLQKYGAIIEKVHHFLEKTDNKELKNNEATSQAFQQTITTLEKIPLIEYQTKWLLIFICLHTNLGKNTIPNSAFQALEKQYKKIVYQPEDKTRQKTFTQETGTTQ